MTNQQAYYVFEQRRRQQAMYRYYAKLARINNLRDLIVKGVNVAEDPRYKDEYLGLMTEFGPAIFVFEDKDKKNHVIVKEENG